MHKDIGSFSSFQLGADDVLNILPAKLRSVSTMALALTIWLAAMIWWGCGKKGPPVPPSGNKPPAVKDLRYSISENTIKLSWTNPKTTEKAKSPAAGFLIYRYQQPVVERECPNCPVIFKKIGDVPAGGAGRNGLQPLIFTQSLEPGYRYIYKVKAYDDEGLGSRDSNYVDFEY